MQIVGLFLSNDLVKALDRYLQRLLELEMELEEKSRPCPTTKKYRPRYK